MESGILMSFMILKTILKKNITLLKNRDEELYKKLNTQIYDWLESTNGMEIHLHRDIFWRADKRKPGH